MRLVSNRGSDRLVDLIRPALSKHGQLGLATAEFSLFAFAELRTELGRLNDSRILLPERTAELHLLGEAQDRTARNQLTSRWLAASCADWLARRAEVRHASGPVPQGAVVISDEQGKPQQAVTGTFSFTTSGLGTAPGNPMNLVYAWETAQESDLHSGWFQSSWSVAGSHHQQPSALASALRALAAYRDAARVYHLVLHHLFGASGGELDEDDIVDAATGIRDTVV